MFWNPHIEDGDAGSANHFFGGVNAGSAYCEKCANAYRLLDLSYGASKAEVKQRKWAFAELFSADRLRTMSEQARQLAEEQHKSINAACGQILRCPDCTGLRDHPNFSESRPAPEQAAGATAPQEESKPQPDKQSLAEQVLVILKETNHKINAIAFVREQTGWSLEEATDFVDSITPEGRPDPEQAAGATTEQEESESEQTGWDSKEAGDFVDSVAPEWRPDPEQAAVAAAKPEALDETGSGRFSVRTVVVVTALVAGSLVGWNQYSSHKAQMETEVRRHLYEAQRLQKERVKEEQQRRLQEACAEKSAARRQHSSIGGSQPVSSNSSLVPQQPVLSAAKDR